MKIAFVGQNINHHSGAPSVAATLIEGLCEGNDMHVFSNTLEGVDNQKIKKIKHHWVPAVPGTWTANILVFVAASILRLALSQLFRRQRFEIIHAVGGYDCLFFPNIVTSHMCERENLELEKAGVVKTPSRTIVDRLRTLDYLIYDRVVVLLEKIQMGRPGRIRIVVSKGLKRDFVRHYGQSAEDILVVPNGVDLAKFHPHNKGLYREEIRDRHHLAPGDFVALFVGSYWGRKGLQYAIQALALVPREDVKLVVVGKWLAQESYLEMARKGGVEDRVVFAGNSKEVYKYYAASDVFLLPTGYEAFPLTSLEAAASGLPILITKVNGVDEWLVDNHNGLFIQQDAEDIATKLQTLLADAELAAMLGDNARRTAEKYSWDAMISKMLEVYQQVASPKR